ncbi:hypothetical protein CBR_g31669 [Chara braunii]|uniref:Reverse transcriptase domain-containing protein n=1 Tax=Chara braunii TaxID=69332 RepID=A0A388JXX7_CHABU|nr:hypothetical protein CBR_g31669 [Chara braunii]|eukprot:GBG62650.1 hypothetical protein CBR_g31669 [Chara braunii]
MILGMSWLCSADHPVNFHDRTVHIRDRNGVLVPCTVATPHTSIACHVVSVARIRDAIARNDVEEMGLVFLHALPSPDGPAASPPDPRISHLLDEYRDVFEAPTGTVSDRPIRHGITLEAGAGPPRGCIYRMSEEELEVLCAQLDDLLDKGWIRPSCSPYGAPVLFVRKKNKDLRLCIDYRTLNAQTVKNTGPLPRIDDLLERLGGATYFSKLDLKSGYHHIEIQPQDRYKTAFKTRYRHFEWVVMPFGLTNAPATFQAAMRTEVCDLLDRSVLIYLDDILVYSRTLDEHIVNLRVVLDRLRRAKYKANLDKCEFAKQELEYLDALLSLLQYVGQTQVQPCGSSASADLEAKTMFRASASLAELCTEHALAVGPNGIVGVDVEGLDLGVDADGLTDGVDAEGVDADGVDSDLDPDGVDADGVDADGLDSDPDGDGVDEDGVEVEGVDEERSAAEGLDAEGVGAEGVDVENHGIFSKDVDADGLALDGVDSDSDGVDAVGVEVEGVDEERSAAEGVDVEGVGAEGVDVENHGIFSKGADADGLALDGLDSDPDGVDADRVDADGAEIEGVVEERSAAEGVDVEGVGAEGVDVENHGIFSKDVDADGLALDGVDSDSDGVDADRVEVEGVDEVRSAAEGVDVEGVGAEGVDVDNHGIFSKGVDADGLALDGVDSDPDGVDAEGVDVDGVEVEGVDENRSSAERVDAEGVGAEGVDVENHGIFSGSVIEEEGNIAQKTSTGDEEGGHGTEDFVPLAQLSTQNRRQRTAKEALNDISSVLMTKNRTPIEWQVAPRNKSRKGAKCNRRESSDEDESTDSSEDSERDWEQPLKGKGGSKGRTKRKECESKQDGSAKGKLARLKRKGAESGAIVKGSAKLIGEGLREQRGEKKPNAQCRSRNGKRRIQSDGTPDTEPATEPADSLEHQPLKKKRRKLKPVLTYLSSRLQVFNPY